MSLCMIARTVTIGTPAAFAAPDTVTSGCFTTFALSAHHAFAAAVGAYV